MSPFYTVEGNGFIEFVQHVIDLVSLKGAMNAKELLPCTDIVKHCLISMNETIKRNLTKHMLNVNYVTCTGDNFTKKYLQERY